MGLCIYPGEASWSYSGFHEFRRRLAAEEGLELEQMHGFGPMLPGSRPHYDPTLPLIEWSEVPTSLEPLLNHSDCD